MKTLARTLLVGILLLTMAVPASAITRGGELDGDAHPYVGLMVAFDEAGEVLWRCSGSLISPTVYVTAGHCTEAPAFSAEVFFQSDVDALGVQEDRDDPNGQYPYGGAGISYSGTTYTHPLYNPDAFFLYDLGVVQLSDAVPTDVVPADEYAKLPEEGVVDDLGKGRKKAVVTAVGYGLQQINPVFIQADRVRYQADLFVVDTKGVAGIGNIQLPGELPPTNSMTLSGDAKHGGTCFGDSGGPVLDGDVLLGVTSFGLNGNCAGIGGAFRIDRDVELDWIGTFPRPIDD